ncbi:MAG: fibronectin type III domain-containing protein [Bacteroidales bacterium]|nr:fibronectin type III domain-containing protein [Bacteroidales bacterium]MCK9498720.1 fibronectin type III domain-containing protein [Bacteroidales bacterium]
MNFGPSITVSPNINTTYYIRAESPCDITNCKSILISVIPLPNTPVVNSASNIGETSFNANWQTVGSASSYILQVSKYNTFSSFVLNTNVGNLTSYNINGLECETTYYYRVKAVNSCGESSFSNIINLNTSNCPFVPTPCPGTPTVTYNGYTYTTVQIKTQCWMVENLRTTKYRDGTSLNSTWGQGTDGRYTNACSGGDGLFYNFYAANDTKKLCPTGWRTPTSTDFQTLMNNTPDASSIMVIGTNSYAWAGYLGGYKTSGGTCYDADKIGFYWTTSLASGNPIDFRLTKSTTNILSYNINNYGTSDKYRGQYVRCIKE